MTLTHLDDNGRARMVDVGGKAHSPRRAVAQGFVACASETLEAVLAETTPKGAVISTAELAGVMAAKRTADLIPLCHPLLLEKVAVQVTPHADGPGFSVRAEVSLTGATGVEMEALTAVSVACLTLYDMLKAIDRGMVIRDVRLVSKEGGKSGSWGTGA
jgi:cyclic pyranopterin phosphate synthase